MGKILLSTIIILFSSGVFADASIAESERSNTILLTAPGTLTGANTRESGIAARSTLPASSFIQPKQYKYIPDHYKFPQYGQRRLQSNPWREDMKNKRVNRPRSSGYNQYDNPWDISNLPPVNVQRYPRKPVNGLSMREPHNGLYGDDYSNSSFFPRFPTIAEERRGLPSTSGGFPFDEMMPGLGKGEDGFPFMPFDMF